MFSAPSTAERHHQRPLGSRRERPQRAGQQRAAGRQELGGDRVRRAPDRGGEGGDQENRRAHRNSLDVKYLDTKRLSLDFLLVKKLDTERMEM
jgi:hypothetical protein